MLCDTHVVLWAAMDSPRLPERARDLLSDPESQLWSSAASIREIVIKSGLGRSDFTVDPVELRRLLLVNGYRELAVSGQHALAIAELPDSDRYSLRNRRQTAPRPTPSGVMSLSVLSASSVSRMVWSDTPGMAARMSAIRNTESARWST